MRISDEVRDVSQMRRPMRMPHINVRTDSQGGKPYLRTSRVYYILFTDIAMAGVPTVHSRARLLSMICYRYAPWYIERSSRIDSHMLYANSLLDAVGYRFRKLSPPFRTLRLALLVVCAAGSRL